jgi:hypothetical protein
MRRIVLLLALLPGALAGAQTGQIPLPQSHIPAPVLFELRSLEARFDQALAQDCAPERCFSKGCVYREHAAVDLPRSGSLPGLGHAEGPGSVPVQEYLTQARCEFTHERSVSNRDVQALVKRLEQRLSKGWLQVSVGRQILEPVSAGLKESPRLPEPLAEPAPAVAEMRPPEPALPVEWDAKLAARELWLSLLPHFSWMIALVLVTLCALMIIWALRRLGRETLEEKAMAAQLAASGPMAPEQAAAEPAEAPPEQQGTPEGGAQDGFAADQQSAWAARIAQAELTSDHSAVVELLRGWLKAGEFSLLAKAILLFGDRLSVAFPSTGELATRKVELAEYLKHVDPAQLPSDQDFFRTLNQHASSSCLLAQADAEVYRSLREEFGSTGICRLVENLPPRHGALLFALCPQECQHEVGRLLSAEMRVMVADQLLVSNRISPEEMGQILEALGAARQGVALPRFPAVGGNVITDRGRPYEAAGALSVLLPLLEGEERRSLFAQALERSGGAFPAWYEDILYPQMLSRLPQELQRDLLLEVDIRNLAGWSSLQSPEARESIIGALVPTMQNAIKASMAFGSRDDQLRMARQGRAELVAGLKRLAARGKVSFSEIVS